jgi:RNA-directed DNA polymerase
LREIATTEEARNPEEWRLADLRKYSPKISELRAKLCEKAKKEPGFRFYSLFGQILRPEVLLEAWGLVAANNGSPGVDGVSIASILATPGDVGNLLKEIERELRAKTYRPAAVKRVMIPKANGKLRPLGIPTVKDRVVQTAVKIVIEPIFEADFQDCSHGFRPGRSAHDALKQVEENIRAGRTAAYDADLSSYFDTIPHDKLMACIEKRIADRSILNLLRHWLTAPVEERDEKGGPPKRHKPQAGTPQGGVISPLLANLYLHWFDKLFHREDGPKHWANARLVRYADDFVIQARYIGDRITTWIEDAVEKRFGLKINRDKTAIRQIKPTGPEGIDFLGQRTWHAPDQYGRDKRYLTVNPTPKAMATEKQNIRKIINHRMGCIPIPDLICRLNRQTTGWANYHQNGRPTRYFKSINSFISNRIIKHLKRRSHRPYRRPKGTTWWGHLTEDLGWKPLLARPSKDFS